MRRWHRGKGITVWVRALALVLSLSRGPGNSLAALLSCLDKGEIKALMTLTGHQ